MKKFYLIALLFPMSYLLAQTPILVENFDYAAGDALTAHSWEAHSAPATNPILVTSPGLTFAGYFGSNIGNAAGVNNTGQDVNRSFTAQENTTVYTSFLVKVTASTADEFFLLLGANPITTAFRGRVFAQPDTDPTKFKFGLSFNAAAAQSTSTGTFNYGETYLVVLKYNSLTGELNDEVSLFVFATGNSIATEPATPVIGPLTGTAADLNPGTVGLRQFSATQAITVDGIRITNIWNVDSNLSVPENTISKIKVYPNPVNNGNLTIASPQSESNEVEIYDLLGKQVLKASGTTINVSGIKTGLYVVKIKNQNETMTQKIIINN